MVFKELVLIIGNNNKKNINFLKHSVILIIHQM